MSKGYFLIALGCDKNIIDAEVMAGRLKREGYCPVGDPAEADIMIVHTCTFVEGATEESIDTILELGSQKGYGKALVVSGCLAQRYPNELAKEIPEVDLILGVGKHTELLEWLGRERIVVSSPEDWDINMMESNTMERIPSTPRHYAFLKVSEGCNNRCSYCVIPLVRGGLRSRPVDDIVAEAGCLREGGIFELNLVAQDLASYGLDLLNGNGLYGLPGLLRSLLDGTDIPWIRLLYLHPKNITSDLIDLVAREERIVSYMDVPVQHCSDTILKSMGRGIEKKGILTLIDEIRSRIEKIYLRTSLIVGYPGEGEGEFKELYNFVRDVKFQNLGVFRYSREEGTRANNMIGHLPEDVIEERYRAIMELQRGISLAENERLVGERVVALIDGISEKGEDESEDPAVFRGRFYGQAPEVDGNIKIRGVGLSSGDVVDVLITGAGHYDLFGEVVKKIVE
ncbi:MAG: 30S ribosomal protein S12 methylthiotransferase RimO [Deltaproteobacteria bacterium]|uniref:Ribosomal protein uS12 methylthiotransferase RimO n=1 Tax=Candidatus Zymogenus saltonus TaxID=2844893 RepID=A0A9D8PR41_9DELT|nr:30S ribosomal protein S12 methylthiotransferase RimO [Candidatus Zymogenus saltonus]